MISEIRFLNILEQIIQENRVDFKQKVIESKCTCVFGAGNMFKDSKEFITNKVNIDFICDSNPDKWGKYIYGVKCISPKELLNIKDVLVILCLGKNVEIARYLKENKVNFINHFNLIWDMDDENLTEIVKLREKILNTLELFNETKSKEIFKQLILNRIAPELVNLTYSQLKTKEKQYMVLNDKLNEYETIVDCGAFDGDTVQSFIYEMDEKIEKVYAFELDYLNFKNMIRNIQSKKIEMINAGVGNENKTINYISTESMHTSINKEHYGQKANMVRLDDCLVNKNISFIKMDIEGFEVEALMGAEKLIKTNKPKLAICIYHKFSDLWIIPNVIKSFRKDYEFVLRHHSNHWSETVLYAY